METPQVRVNEAGQVVESVERPVDEAALQADLDTAQNALNASVEAVTAAQTASDDAEKAAEAALTALEDAKASAEAAQRDLTFQEARHAAVTAARRLADEQSQPTESDEAAEDTGDEPADEAGEGVGGETVHVPVLAVEE